MLTTIKDSIVACMATYPDRFDVLERSARSISGQLDHLFIYVNETLDGFPDLTSLKNVTILNGAEHEGNISANGKVYPLNLLSNCLVFTIDDDFIYPSNYVSKIKFIFKICKNNCCVAVHGSILPPELEWYFDRTHVFAARDSLLRAELVNLAGSGTFAFHQSTLNTNFSDFQPDVQVDLIFSSLARQRGLPIWSPSRPKDWLIPLRPDGLMQDMKKEVTYHTYEARKLDWSFSVYRDIATKALQKNGRPMSEIYSDLNLSQALISALGTGRTPANWQTSRKNFLARRNYLRLLSPKGPTSHNEYGSQI
ncbi:hypothetical protein AAD018_004495 [Aestuariibius insulae]